MNYKSAVNILLFFVVVCYSCYAEDVIFIDNSMETSYDEYKLRIACEFYGLSIEHLVVKGIKSGLLIADALKAGEACAIVIAENALPYINKEILFSLHKECKKKMPLLIMGVTPAIDSRILVEWSNGTIMGCASLVDIPLSGYYKVANFKDVTRELSGQEISFCKAILYHLILNENKRSTPVSEIIKIRDNELFPIFVRTVINERDVFFLTRMFHSDLSGESDWHFNVDYFFEIAPIMIFLRYSCGERCWHSISDFANFTIDDPWLIEPYGHLSYVRLLEEMEKANFHTTIAFIPWNYDRSKSKVVSIFKYNPKRFSICIHGNDHDRQEFYIYKTKFNESFKAKALYLQEEDIRQALARMARFRDLTGLPYDKVMVFPHGIAPAITLRLLKKYSFIATVNADNMPLGSQRPTDPLFQLRPVTLKFEGFPSLKRYAPMESQSDIAINLFLDNPLLFYSHPEFFEDGIDAFNKIAKMVNNIQPGIVWQSLGYICQHFYLEKLRDDGNYDVLVFSSNFIIENTHQNDLIYFVRKEESYSFPIKKVTVDGQSHSYKKSENSLMLEIRIPGGESRHIILEYENKLDLTSVNITKNDSRVNRLRKLSDFRDIILSRSVIGRAITHVYYKTGLYKFGLMRLTFVLIVLIIFMALGILYLIKRRKRQKKI